MPKLPELYQRELAYYRVALLDMARRHSEIAHMVDGRAADPSVERLLQGSALLTARLRRRTEDAFSEIVLPVLDNCWPQPIRPVPALVMLQAEPLARSARVRHIPRATRLRLRCCADNSSGDEFQFITTSPLDLTPATLAEVRTEQPSPSELRLSLSFDFYRAQSFQRAQMPYLRLHLTGPATIRHMLYLSLCCHLRAVEIEDEHGQTCLRLPASAVQPIGLSADESLLPLTGDGNLDWSLRLQRLAEYFDCMDKFLGVDVAGLENAPVDAPGPKFRLVFVFRGAPKQLVDASLANFALHRVIAVNLSPVRAVRLNVPAGSTSCVVGEAEKRSLFSVEKVCLQGGAMRRWTDFTSALSSTAATEADLPLYDLESLNDFGSTRSRLLFLDATGKAIWPGSTVEAWVRLWDPHLPTGSRTRLEAVDQPGTVRFEPMGHLYPPRFVRLDDSERLWSHLAQLTMRLSDLSSAEGLSQLIRTLSYGRSAIVEPQVLGVASHNERRLHQRMVVPVRRVEIDLADNSFGGAGQLYLFARLISGLFKRPAASNALFHVRVRGQPSGTAFDFGPQ